jgi:glycosyltransferase involved in cell wall biosynthesis
MRVLLVGNYVNDGQESMQRFTAFMAQGLKQAGHDVRVLKPRAFFGLLCPADHGLGKWLGYVDKFGPFPFVLKTAARWADIVHICDHSNALYTRHLQHVPHVVTCHDLLAIRSALGEIPENRTGRTGRQLQKLIVQGLTGAQHIACVSEATRKELLRLTDVPEHRVSRIYNSLTYPYSRMKRTEARRRLHDLGLDPRRPFLLHVGGNQWYKNRLGVLRIFSILRNLTKGKALNLVLVGKPWTTEMRQFVLEHGMSEVVFGLTEIAYEDLRALYSTAALMLFPSLQEGFGWPIIEAQGCGCPVVTSRRSPMDEVGGDAAIYVDPQDPSSSAAIVKETLERPNTMREGSLRNVTRFNSGMIEAYLSLYDRLCQEGAARIRTAMQPMTASSAILPSDGQ